MTRIRSLGTLAMVAATCTLAACGGTSSSLTSKSSGAQSAAAVVAADPSSVVPADALLYVQADLRPSGALASGIDAGAKKLVGIADPGAMIVAAIDSAIKQPGVSYENSIRPWLGEQAGVALLGASAGKPSVAIVAETADAALAQKDLFALVRGARGSAPVTGNYRGVDYLASADGGVAVAVAGPFAVIGSLGALRQVVDVERGAAALAAAPDYQAAVAHSLNGSEATAFVRTRALLDLLVSAAGGSATSGGQSMSVSSATSFSASRTATSTAGAGTTRATTTSGALMNALGLTDPGTAARAAALSLLDKLIPSASTIFASARLDAGGLTIDVATPTDAAAGGGPSDLFASLPSGSWLAFGESGIGAAVRQLTGLVTPATGSSGNCSLAQGATQPTCTTTTQTLAPQASPLAAYTAVLKQITDVAGFAKGSSLATLEAGIELRLDSAADAGSLLTMAKGLLSGLGSGRVTLGVLSVPGVDAGFTATVSGIPLAFDVAQKGDLLIVALGPASLSDAIATGARLGDSLTGGLLGSGVQPILGLSLADVGTLLKGFGLDSNATVATILPYLQSLGTLAVGQSVSAGDTVTRIAVG